MTAAKCFTNFTTLAGLLVPKPIDMNESVAYTLSRLFMYAAYTTPLISFLIVRKKENRIAAKIIIAVVLTLVLAGLFLLMAMWLFLLSGEVS